MSSRKSSPATGTSHLYGLYPGDQICPHCTPDLFAAAMRLNCAGGQWWAYGLEPRLDGLLLARAGDGAPPCRAPGHRLCDRQPAGLHPPRIFQIDGNLGMAASSRC